MIKPKVFISYSWTNQIHQETVRAWADRLLSDGVEVTLDEYDFKEGADKYAFMETMVSDASVTHVLVFCDKRYAQKADARESGVGTESQIISNEIYKKVAYSKFIPIVCEFDGDQPCLPMFLRSRKWFDFSSAEQANANWERLIRFLFNKPLNVKPQVASPPIYIQSEIHPPATPVAGKFATLKSAIENERRTVPLHRKDFIESCISYLDALRVREHPNIGELPNKIIQDTALMIPIRNHLVDWVLLETRIPGDTQITDSLLDLLEQLLELKLRPKEITSWSSGWFDAHALFVYHTLLYIVAALSKNNSWGILNAILTSKYLQPEAERSGDCQFVGFGGFYAYSDTINSALTDGNNRYLAPAAELLKRQADKPEVTFSDLKQADAILLFMAFLSADEEWYPQTVHYWNSHSAFPFFLRSSQKRYFKNLVALTGCGSAEEIKRKVTVGSQRLNSGRWNIGYRHTGFASAFNLDKLDTV